MMADSCASVAVPAPAMGRTGSAASASAAPSLGQRASAAEGAGRAQAAHRTLAAREARPIERAGRCGAEQGDASRAVAARSTAARKAIHRCFTEKVLLDDPREAELQQRAGVCERIRAVARTLGGTP